MQIERCKISKTKKRVHPQRKINQAEEFVILAYTRYIDCEPAKDYTGVLPALLGQLGEKYFDYNSVLPDCLNNPEEKIF
jgi:hypothetical protein